MVAVQSSLWLLEKVRGKSRRGLTDLKAAVSCRKGGGG